MTAKTAALKAISRVEDKNLRTELIWSLTGSRSGQVECFHKLYNLPIATTTDSVLSHMTNERIKFRLGLILEEVRELFDEGFGIKLDVKFNGEYDYELDSAAFDVPQIAKELADVSYVIDGFAIEAGIPLDKVLDEVQASNLTKLGEDGKPIYREDGKVLKGPYYTEADVASVIFKEV